MDYIYNQFISRALGFGMISGMNLTPSREVSLYDPNYRLHNQ